MTVLISLQSFLYIGEQRERLTHQHTHCCSSHKGKHHLENYLDLPLALSSSAETENSYCQALVENVCHRRGRAWQRYRQKMGVRGGGESEEEESCQFALGTPRTRSRLVVGLDECVCALGNLARVVGVVGLVYTCSDTSLCVCAKVTNHTRVLEMTAWVLTRNPSIYHAAFLFTSNFCSWSNTTEHTVFRCKAECSA